MSRFFSEKYKALTPYTPGEQPRDKSYIKLNTNESPFPPSPYASRFAREQAGELQLYSDPTCHALVAAATEVLGVGEDEILFSNGSDEILNFAFQAFCDKDHPAVFPDISYGFYPVFAALNGVPYKELPLADDFSLRVEDYLDAGGTVFIANPNAPTGLALSLADVESIVKGNPSNVVVIDEAYVDFGAESARSLIRTYDNLLVCQTFSKSRSLAGGRLGFGMACPELIRDLNTVKYSTNPYNVNRMTMAAGVGALLDTVYFDSCRSAVIKTRGETTEALRARGFTVLDSAANFIFAKHPFIGGNDLYLALKEKGVLVRHFEKPRLKDFNRITIGSDEQMAAFLAAVDAVTEEKAQ